MIYAVTFNPAVDKYIRVDGLKIGETNYYQQEMVNYAGKAQNVVRIISQFTNDYHLISKESKEVESLIERDYKDVNKHLFLDESVRMNLKVEDNGRITELNQQVKDGESKVSREIELYLKDMVNPEDLVLFSGKLTRYEIDLIKKFKNETKNENIIIDSNSLDLEDLREIKPLMIKPNDEEIAQLLDIPMSTDVDYVKEASLLRDLGIDRVIVSLGSKGSIYVGPEGNYEIGVPEGRVVNTVGAGDSFVGGFVTGLYLQYNIEDVLRLAAASGSATAYSSGIGSEDLIEKLKTKIEVKKI